MAVPAAISSYKTKSLARKTDSHTHTLTPIFFNVICLVFPTLKTSYSGLIREEGLYLCLCECHCVMFVFFGGCVALVSWTMTLRSLLSKASFSVILCQFMTACELKVGLQIQKSHVTYYYHVF